MGRAKQLIIAEQEESSMVSTWTEYLVLERRAKTKDWRLFVGKYEALAEAGFSTRLADWAQRSGALHQAQEGVGRT